MFKQWILAHQNKHLKGVWKDNFRTTEGAEVTPARFKGNPREVGDTHKDAAMLSLWGRSLTSGYSSKNEKSGLIFGI